MRWWGDLLIVTLYLDVMRIQVEVGRGPILDPDAYMGRLDLRQLPEAATYCGVGPPVSPESAAETQVWMMVNVARVRHRRAVPQGLNTGRERNGSCPPLI